MSKCLCRKPRISRIFNSWRLSEFIELWSFSARMKALWAQENRKIFCAENSKCQEPCVKTQGVFGFLSMSESQDSEHSQELKIPEAVKNAFAFYELKQIGYTKSIFEVLRQFSCIQTSRMKCFHSWWHSRTYVLDESKQTADFSPQ